MVASEQALLGTVDRIYEAIERPELWPKTIYAIGELIGGRRHFWGLDQSTDTSNLDLKRRVNPYEVGCYGSGPGGSGPICGRIRRADHSFPQTCFPEHPSISER